MTFRGVFVFMGIAMFELCSLAHAQNVVQKYWTENYGVSLPAPDGKYYQYSRLAKAQPDECFGSLNPDLSFAENYPGDLTEEQKTACLISNQLKTNQAYVWGITSWGHDVWFGTLANTLCLVAEGLGSGSFSTNTVACQGLYQDVRPPRIFLYDTKADQPSTALIDMTPQVIAKSSDDEALLKLTTGIRSAGSLGDVVFFGGIAPNGITMFAFNGRTRTFIGSIYYDGNGGRPKYSNIRQWLVTNNSLYVGVAGENSGPLGGFGSDSGYILRWTGTTADPFHFETVGNIDGDPAYLARYQDRLFVTIWGGPAEDIEATYGTQLYMSPSISALSPDTADDWKPVWKYADYEVEPSAVMGGGALAEHDGWLYWSTMIPPGVQALVFTDMYDQAPSAFGFLGSYRPTTMFRGKFLDTESPMIELVYGNAYLPKYVESGTTDGCTNTGETCEWAIVPNNMDGVPGLYGLAGYGNPFNSYTWWMTQYNGELFFGTFDWSYLVFESLFDQYAGQIPPAVIAAAREFEGADLFRIHSPNDPAYPVDLDGVGNFSNYGVRTMLWLGSELYLGMANPFNLLNEPINVDYQDQLGGWELLHLKPTALWYQTYCSQYKKKDMPSYCIQ